ncbi:hypothetical protein RFI_00976 [Reticulomyxa filosa]|uniref:Thioredoxin domain-containing protein n=1 Tax=Reticulomyxa filosa TaxID=46433 RepID=X6PCZ6_RETFI|nr:hypothetical protein RFI_00976 [Reticulomyxa filosa]|eukprot:ETO36091.1 hypothetical protein RFI_00976 [Reticulomyxa filosa]
MQNSVIYCFYNFEILLTPIKNYFQTIIIKKNEQSYKKKGKNHIYKLSFSFIDTYSIIYQSLETMSKSLDSTIMKCQSDSDYSNALQKAKGKPVLIDFFATWYWGHTKKKCGPCKAIEPELEKLAKQYAKEIAFIKVDVDQCRGVAKQFGIRAMPTFVSLSADKNEYQRLQGADVEKLKALCAELTQKFQSFQSFSGKAHTLKDTGSEKNQKEAVDLSSMADLVENLSLKDDQKDKEGITVQLIMSGGEKKLSKLLLLPLSCNYMDMPNTYLPKLKITKNHSNS